MNNILELIGGGLGNQIVENISKESGSSADETASVVSAALPALLGALQSNASEGGAQGILSAINKKHDGSILDNISSLGAATAADGNGILKHVLGAKQGGLETAISKQTGVSAANVSKIIAMLAPIVMGYLGKQTKGNNVNSDQGLTDLLGGLLGGNSGADILGSLLGGGDKGGLGSLLGGLGSLLGKK